MGFEQASALLTALYSQVTGSADASTPVDTSSFISMAQATLRSGYEPVMSAISQVLGRTLIAVRPYSRKFKGLEMTADRWGGITRKINFIDNALDSADPTFALVEGQPVDQFVVKKPKVLETHYYGQNVYESSYTIFTKQLDTAFSSPAEFASFMSGLMTHFSNEREQYLETLSRSILCNLIGAKKVLADASVANQVIDLLAEYNTATGQSLTATTVKLPANYPAFCKWAYAYIQHVSEMFTERTGMFQRPLTNYAIMRHTPKADQRLFMDADFLAHMTAEVLADTYHDNFLRYSEVEAVNFWQSALEPSTVNVKPVYLNASAEYVNAESAVEIDNVVGVLIDRDAAGYNLADDDLVSSPYNAKGQYYNLFNHVRIQLQNDLTEKAVVFCIGGSVNPSPTPSTKLYEGGFTTTQEDPNYPAQGDIQELLTVVPKATPPASLNVNFKGTDYELPLIDGSIAYGEGSGGSYVYTTYPLVVELWADPAGGDFNGLTIYTAAADTGEITISFTPAS